MLIHTEGKVEYHEEDKKRIKTYISIIQNKKPKPKIEKYLERMEEIAIKEISDNSLSLQSDDVLKFIIDNIGKNSVLTINHTNKNNQSTVKEACSPIVPFTFVIGGNIVSRGLTFERLLTFFFSRTVKHKFQQNTYIQRARMFGNRPYSKYFELCIPEELFANWANCFFDHELSLQSAMAGDYVHISSDRTSPADSASINKATTLSYDREWRVGSIIPMPSGIESMFQNNMKGKPIDFIQQLISDKTIPEESFNTSMLGTIKSMGLNDQSDIVIALDRNNEIQCPINDKYFDEDTISRTRGGLVSQLTKDSSFYNDKAIIMPVKNSSNQMRFYFKTNLGKKVIKNIRNNMNKNS